MSHKPPTFSHSPDPLQADDWIKTVEKMLNLAQIGGMLTQQLMTTPTLSAGRSSEASSGSSTYPRA
jgi:hypothetical protein